MKCDILFPIQHDIFFNLHTVCSGLSASIDIELAKIKCSRSVTCTIDEISSDGSEYEYDQPDELAFQVISDITKELPINFVMRRDHDLIKIKNALEDFFIEWVENELPHLVVDYAVDHRVSADEVRAGALREERTLNS
jgi:hypothetical protein